ncbi:MAG: haloacid dehalogenase type II [Burkholderiales bacterium]
MDSQLNSARIRSDRAIGSRIAENPGKVPSVKALAFDVFGTVVDWRRSIIREIDAFAAAHGLNIDSTCLADAWRAGYKPTIERVRSGELPWMNIDALHRLILDSLLKEFSVTRVLEAELDHLNRAWHRLKPWPDSIEGLVRLKRGFIITTLSNGTFALLANMAKHAGLPWDCIISAELFRHYKPDPETYLGTATLLGLEPGEVMLVAAHPDDLRAAKAQGCRTAFVKRPLEFGADQPLPTTGDREFDIIASDFLNLARQLDC